MRPPKPTGITGITAINDWGPSVLRPARDAQGLSRPDLARLSGVAESTIAKLEQGQHQPRRRSLLRLCKALNLPSPLPGAELRIPLGSIAHDLAVRTLRQALQEFRATRADADAFAQRRSAAGAEHVLAVYQALDARDTASALLTLLSDEDTDMPEPKPPTRRPAAWRLRREEAGITQEELATRAGLSFKKLKAIEAGQAEPTPTEAKGLDAIIRQGPARP